MLDSGARCSLTTARVDPGLLMSLTMGSLVLLLLTTKGYDHKTPIHTSFGVTGAVALGRWCGLLTAA